MIHEEKCFCATCDNCGKTFESNHEGFTMFGTDDQLYQEMDNSEWYVGNDPDHENKYYCNECFKWHPDIDDKIILDATRTKQLDESHTAHTEEQLPVLTELEIENAVKELSKQSTAPDKETPDWMQSDIRRGIKWAIERLSNRYSKDDVFKILTKIQDAGLTITPHTRTWVKNYEKEINNIINAHTEELSTPPVREVKSAEDVRKQFKECIISQLERVLKPHYMNDSFSWNQIEKALLTILNKKYEQDGNN